MSRRRGIGAGRRHAKEVRLEWWMTERTMPQAMREAEAAMERIEREEREAERRKTRLYNVDGRIMPVREEREP